MRIPNANKAVIDSEKLRNYILSPIHPVGRLKATFFKKLGYSTENWKVLEQDLRNQILSQNVNEVKETRYGRYYSLSWRVTWNLKD